MKDTIGLTDCFEDGENMDRVLDFYFFERDREHLPLPRDSSKLQHVGSGQNSI